MIGSREITLALRRRAIGAHPATGIGATVNTLALAYHRALPCASLQRCVRRTSWNAQHNSSGMRNSHPPCPRIVRRRGSFLRPRVYKQSPAARILIGMFLCSAAISAGIASIVQNDTYPLIFTAGIAAAFVVCAGFWTFGEGQVVIALKTYCLTSSALFVVAWLLTRQPGTRFGALIHPNLWGLLCFANFSLSGLIPRSALRTAVQTGNLAIILDAQSRTALLATLVSAAVLAYFGLRSLRWRKHDKLLLTLAIVSVALASGFTLKRQIVTTFSDAFMLDDQYRGMGTGFSGRTELWEQGIAEIKDNPIFGVGPRMEVNYVSGLGYSHSGYISTFAQYGVVGGTLFFSLVLVCVRRLWEMVVDRRPYIGVAISFVVGYGTVAIFEPKLISIGNPASLIALIFLLLPRESTMSRLIFRETPGIRFLSQA